MQIHVTPQQVGELGEFAASMLERGAAMANGQAWDPLEAYGYILAGLALAELDGDADKYAEFLEDAELNHAAGLRALLRMVAASAQLAVLNLLVADTADTVPGLLHRARDETTGLPSSCWDTWGTADVSDHVLDLAAMVDAGSCPPPPPLYVREWRGVVHDTTA